jgi:hypothetical protein
MQAALTDIVCRQIIPMPFLPATMANYSPIHLTTTVIPSFQIQDHSITTVLLYDLFEYATSRLLACRRAMVASYATNMVGFKDAFEARLSWELEV